MPSKIETVALKGWRGGVNLTADPSTLAPDEAALLVNFDLGRNGELVLRKGGVATSLSGGLVGENLQWIWHFWPADATEPQLVLANLGLGGGTRRIWWTNKDGVEINNLSTANNGAIGPQVWPYTWWPQAIVMNNKAYICRAAAGKVYELKSDIGGDTPTAINPWDGNTNVTVEFPQAVALLVAHERVFAANIVSADGTTNVVDRLYFSELLSPLSWNTTNFIDVGPDQGQAITALKLFGDQIVIFKENSIWGLTGSDFTDISVQLYQINGGIGCKSPASIVDVGNGLVFMDSAKGIFLYDGSTFNDIGQKVFGFIRDLIQDSALSAEQFTAWYHDGKYHLRVAGGHGVFVFDLTHAAWTRQNWAPAFITSYVLDGVTKVRGVFAGDDLVDMYEGYLNPDGTTIRAQLRTGWLSPAGISYRYRLRGAEVLATAEERAFTLFLLADFEPSSFASAAWAFPNAGEQTSLFRTHAGNGQRWRAVQAVISAPSSSDMSIYADGATISEINLHVSALPSRRGELSP